MTCQRVALLDLPTNRFVPLVHVGMVTRDLGFRGNRGQLGPAHVQQCSCDDHADQNHDQPNNGRTSELHEMSLPEAVSDCQPCRYSLQHLQGTRLNPGEGSTTGERGLCVRCILSDIHLGIILSRHEQATCEHRRRASSPSADRLETMRSLDLAKPKVMSARVALNPIYLADKSALTPGSGCPHRGAPPTPPGGSTLSQRAPDRRPRGALQQPQPRLEQVLEERHSLDAAPITPDVMAKAIDLQHQLAGGSASTVFLFPT